MTAIIGLRNRGADANNHGFYRSTHITSTNVFTHIMGDRKDV